MMFTAIILAAGKGTRMRSSLPKPLHRLAGKPLIEWVLDSTITAEAKHAVMVVGADDSQVSDHINQINPAPLASWIRWFKTRLWAPVMLSKPPQKNYKQKTALR